MNERGNPAPEAERASQDSDQNSAPSESRDQADNRVDLATAYSRRSRRAAEPAVDQAEYRVRDFKPADSPADAHGQGTDDGGQLSYRTQAAPAGTPPMAPQPVVNSVPPEFAAPPRPMTRRELRELEKRQGIRPEANDGPGEVPPPPVVRLEPPVPVPAPAPTQSAAPPAASPAAPPAAPPPAPQAASPEPVVFTDASGAAPVNRASVAPRPVGQPNAAPQASASPAPASAAPASPTSINRGIDWAPEVFSAPDAPWQTQTQIDAANQSADAFTRSGGSGALTTNALVIPSIPQASDITRPFSSTGEILVTGSIDLPMTLGSTGAHPARYDHSDIDALFAQEDHDYAPADAAPVRAIRAVSTHTSTHGVISAKKPANNRLPMLMAVTAGILAVGVAALFAAGMIFGYF